MSNETVTYTCQQCGYQNVWTLDRILRLGQREVYRGNKEIYSLPCQRPGRPSCPGRYEVAVTTDE